MTRRRQEASILKPKFGVTLRYRGGRECNRTEVYATEEKAVEAGGRLLEEWSRYEDVQVFVFKILGTLTIPKVAPTFTPVGKE